MPLRIRKKYMPANMNKTYHPHASVSLCLTHYSSRENGNETHVESSHPKNDNQIPPMVSIRHVELDLHIRVRRLKGTVCTSGGRVRVGEVPPCKGDVRVQVRAAAQPRGWFDRHELGGRAGDQLVAKRWEDLSVSFRSEVVERLTLAKETLGDVGKGGDVVHPLPPP